MQLGRLFVDGPLDTYVVNARANVHAICNDCQRAYLAGDGARWFAYVSTRHEALAWCEAHVAEVHAEEVAAREVDGLELGD